MKDTWRCEIEPQWVKKKNPTKWRKTQLAGEFRTPQTVSQVTLNFAVKFTEKKHKLK
jgi:hypothetical protein